MTSRGCPRRPKERNNQSVWAHTQQHTMAHVPHSTPSPPTPPHRPHSHAVHGAVRPFALVLPFAFHKECILTVVAGGWAGGCEARRQAAQAAAPTARVRLGCGQNSNKTYGVHEDATRRKAIEAYNAKTHHDDGCRRHRVPWPLGKPVHATTSRYWYEYIPLDCTRCDAKGIWKRRRAFESSSCDDTVPFIDVKRR